MGFWSLVEAASMPIVQILLISSLGAFLATDRCKLLHKDSRRSLNKIVFMVFTPSLMFANLAKTVTLKDIISWWFMPVNMGFTYLIGGVLGWLVVKIFRPRPHLDGLVVAACSSGNMGNLPLIIIPAICSEGYTPFGDRSTCRSTGLSYASFSKALGGFYLWTYTYQLVRSSAMKFRALETSEGLSAPSPNNDFEADQEAHLFETHGDDAQGENSQRLEALKGFEFWDEIVGEQKMPFWEKASEFLKETLKQLSTPPTLCAMAGLVFGATKWLRNLIIGDNAPLKIIQDSVQTLGDGAIPCITLILGSNLIQGLRGSAIKPFVVVGVVCVRYVVLPAIGIGIVKAAERFGFLPPDPLFEYVLMLQYVVPPAMNIATITQLFNVGQDECSVLFMWTYLVAALPLTVWSTIFLSV